MKISFILPLLTTLKPLLKAKIDAEVNDGDDNYAIELQLLLVLIEAAELLLSDGR